jgi:ribosomal protein S18 acetylase RimI-like enzyme
MYLLRQTSEQFLDKVALCHIQCFPNSFGIRLSFNYTKRSLEWFLVGENRFLFHIESDNKVIGYCGGFRSSFAGDGSTSSMLQYAIREAMEGLIKKPYLLFHPDVLKRYPLIFRNIFRISFNSKKNTSVNYDNTKIGLVVIGVHPDYRGKGVFDLLMKNFEQESQKRDASKITLSVKASNLRAIAAYKKAGWQIDAETKKDINMFKIMPLSSKRKLVINREW